MTESEVTTDWENIGGAIVERPRAITRHPLLDSIYQRHDELIGEYAEGRTLEVAFGRHSHPTADVGIEAYPENNHQAEGVAAVTADARSLPFTSDSFDTVIGRRFLHHVPASDRGSLLTEARRVLTEGGNLVLIEGTPGLYRRVTKGIAFKLGILGEDNDEYGHIGAVELLDLVSRSGFDIAESHSLGSPLMPLCALKAEWTRRLIGLYERTQFVRWWTFVVARPSTGGVPQ